MDYQSFINNYEIKEKLGRNFIYQLLQDSIACTVRKVIRKDSKQIYAAKIYEADFCKAKNQIDLLIKLDHPSIVNIYQIYQQESILILILEYMAGGELYSYICQKKRFTELEVKEYVKILVDAVRYCHDLGIVHRDIKPENLLLTTLGPDRVLKLADFGISKILGDEKLNTMIGTPVYMAPEIWNLKYYDEKVDIWSIGVVMYYLLSGEHPFKGDKQYSLRSEILKEEVDFKADIWQYISPRAIMLLRQLLNKDPFKRPPAKHIQHHLWFLNLNSIKQKSIQTQTQIHLEIAVQKISMYVLESKLTRKKQTLEVLWKGKHKIHKARRQFLCAKGSEEISESSKTESTEK